MALKAGRRGLNKRLVDAFGNLNGEAPSGDYYTKQQTDNKFETKTHVNNTFQKKTLEVPLEMLSGSKLTVEDALQGLNTEKFTYADNGVLGAKNLLPNNATSQTKKGITFTVNADKSVTINGTSTGEWVNLNLATYNLPKGKYIINGIRGGSQNTYRLNINFTNQTSLNLTVYDGYVAFELPQDDIAEVSISVRYANVTLNNVTIHPMIRLASDPDDTYVPYAMTNRELTDRFAVLEFTTDATATDNDLSYPVGFNQNNTYVFLFMVKDSSGYWINGLGTYIADERIFCVLKPNVITVSAISSDYKGKDMKLLLMKI